MYFFIPFNENVRARHELQTKKQYLHVWKSRSLKVHSGVHEKLKSQVLFKHYFPYYLWKYI